MSYGLCSNVSAFKGLFVFICHESFIIFLPKHCSQYLSLMMTSNFWRQKNFTWVVIALVIGIGIEIWSQTLCQLYLTINSVQVKKSKVNFSGPVPWSKANKRIQGFKPYPIPPSSSYYITWIICTLLCFWQRWPAVSSDGGGGACSKQIMYACTLFLLLCNIKILYRAYTYCIHTWHAHISLSI